ncbi:MAG: DNA adenine methylase [Actinomycetota bacterium]
MTEQLKLPALSEETDSGEFRTVQYLGSKYRILDRIVETIENVARPSGSVVDLFAGSGVVARRISDSWPTVAVDIQEYSRVLASALLAPTNASDEAIEHILEDAHHRAADLQSSVRELLNFEQEAVQSAYTDPTALVSVLENGSMLALDNQPDAMAPVLRQALSEGNDRLSKGPGSVMLRYYGGVYFSYTQALELDAIAEAARDLPGTARVPALAAVLSTASQVVTSVGSHFAQPINPRTADGAIKQYAVESILKSWGQSVFPTFRRWLDRYFRLTPTRFGGSARRQDFRAALEDLPDDVAAVYADPPYTRDHYSRFYHVLETLARGDEPLVSTVNSAGSSKLSKGLYRTGRHQSPFCIKSQAPTAFRQLMEPLASQHIPLVISYSPYQKGTRSRPRLMTVEALSKLAGEFYPRVAVESVGRIAHSKLNNKATNAEVCYDAELLVVCSG